VYVRSLGRARPLQTRWEEELEHTGSGGSVSACVRHGAHGTILPAAAVAMHTARTRHNAHTLFPPQSALPLSLPSLHPRPSPSHSISLPPYLPPSPRQHHSIAGAPAVPSALTPSRCVLLRICIESRAAPDPDQASCTGTRAGMHTSDGFARAGMQCRRTTGQARPEQQAQKRINARTHTLKQRHQLDLGLERVDGRELPRPGGVVEKLPQVVPVVVGRVVL
jgi:hypothetical protein